MVTVAYAAEWISKKELSNEEEKRGRGGDDGTLTDDGDSTYSEIEDGPPLSTTNADGSPHTNTQQEDEETIDITPGAALFFVFIASCTLILFFFYDMSVVILVIYIIGATISISVVFVHPMLLAEMKTGRREKDNSDCIFILAIAASLGICLLWYFQKSSPWSWVLQDLG